jgi:hypothetical protein
VPEVDAATGREFEARPESQLNGIERRELHAVVGGEAADVDGVDGVCVEPFGEAGLVLASVVEEAAVAVDLGAGALREDAGDAVPFEGRGEARTGGALNAMHGPERLAEAVELDLLEGGAARVVGGEAAVVGGVPILGGDDDGESPHEFIGDWDHLVAVGHSEGTSGKEVVLDVDEDEGGHEWVGFGGGTPIRACQGYSSKWIPRFRSLS